MSGVRVEVLRGGRVESVHELDAAVVEGGAVVARAGRPEVPVFTRSAIKPFQAMPLVDDGVAERFGLTDEELALCCASHSGEPRHVALAAGILARIGLADDALACGPHAPFHGDAARALQAEGREPGRIHNNCSGKHAGMLALARARGWPVAGYHEAGHPVQQRMLDEVARWTGEPRDRIGAGVDGCGVVTFAVPLTGLATAFARLAAESAAAGTAEETVEGTAEGAGVGSGARRIVGAMTGHPYLVGGTGRLCTRLMEVTGGRILAKVGAEGVYGAAAVDRGLGVALKARDGARRAAEVGLLGLLEGLGLVTADELDALREWARPVVRNTRGEAVGELRPMVALEAVT